MSACNCPDRGPNRGAHCRAARGFAYTSDDWCNCACHTAGAPPPPPASEGRSFPTLRKVLDDADGGSPEAHRLASLLTEYVEKCDEEPPAAREVAVRGTVHLSGVHDPFGLERAYFVEVRFPEHHGLATGQTVTVRAADGGDR